MNKVLLETATKTGTKSLLLTLQEIIFPFFLSINYVGFKSLSLIPDSDYVLMSNSLVLLIHGKLAFRCKPHCKFFAKMKKACTVLEIRMLFTCNKTQL